MTDDQTLVHAAVRSAARRPERHAPEDANAAATYDAQARPENSWVLHPAVDGCAPVVEPRPGGGLH